MGMVTMYKVWLVGVVVRRYCISLNKSLPRINAGSVYTPGVSTSP